MTNRWAVVVGVNEFFDRHHYGRLRACVADAVALHAQLLAGGYDPGRVRLITDDTSPPPVQNVIRDAVEGVVRGAEPGDSVLVYFSGHGDYDEGTATSYLVAQDAFHSDLPRTAVSIVWLRQTLDEARLRGRLLILDACRSGAAVRKSAPTTSPQFIRRVFEQAEGMAVLSSCQQGQNSYEFDERSSVFSKYLVDGLAGAAAQRAESLVTVQDLNVYVTDKVKLWANRNNLEQTPTLVTAMSGDLVVVDRSAAEPDPSRRVENPFFDHGMIRDPDRFFGRAEELREAFEELRKGVNLQIVAPHLEGTSSFLMQLLQRGPEELGRRPEDFGYLNLEIIGDDAEFWDALCETLSLDDTYRGFRLKRALRSRTEPGKPKVLLLDNIERMTNDFFSLPLRGELRGQADDIDARLKLVVATRRPLKDVFTDAPEELSPLAGICHPIHLDPFRDDEARAFLEHRLAGSGLSFAAEAVSAIVAEAAGRPAELQRLAGEHFERLRDDGS